MSLKKWLNRHNLLISTIGVTVLVLLLYLTRFSLRGPYLNAEYAMQDWIYKKGKTAPIDERIYFLYDDEASHRLDQMWDDDFAASPILHKMKSDKWPREVFAAILDKVAGAGAIVVALDYVFRGESPDPESDSIFREAIEHHSGRVVLASQLDDKDVSGQDIRTLNYPAVSVRPQVSPARVGFINIFPDADGVVRRFPMRFTLEEMAGKSAPPGATEYLSLPVQSLIAAGMGDLIPKGKGDLRVRFAYRGETRADIKRPQSVANIFSPSLWAANYKNGEVLRDKIVLVGPTGNMHKDVALSPFGIIGGPEFHLNVMQALLSKSFLYESSLWVDIMLIGASGLLALGLARWVANAILRMVLITLAVTGYFFVALWLFNYRDLIIPVFSPMLTLAASGFVFIVWQQVLERMEKASMRRTFERYVSHDVVKELIDNPASYLNTVGGARKNVTVLFSDVRDFTTITESGDEQALVKHLNEYFDGMVNIVFEERGTLDKFIGDAVMAQWGGIYTEGEKADASHAVRAAVRMRKKLAEMNNDWTARGMIPLRFGIGVNYGEAIVGNLGCEEKMEVSLIGDAVNVASRLEGMTKQYHVDLLIGETLEAL
ncbi:MAG: adenylate/guanylate cyclase domain-containing protein, partial [Chthoniobacteraceae bacterium]